MQVRVSLASTHKSLGRRLSRLDLEMSLLVRDLISQAEQGILEHIHSDSGGGGAFSPRGQNFS